MSFKYCIFSLDKWDISHYTNSDGSSEPAYPRSLAGAFAVCSHNIGDYMKPKI